VPIGGFRVATNQNDILYGSSRPGSIASAPSSEPRAVDGHPSRVEFERFIYFEVGARSGAGAGGHANIKATGAYTFRISTATSSARRAAPMRRFRHHRARPSRARLYCRSAHGVRFKELNPIA